jgi:SAM-dependent methyltransferase
MNSYLHRAARKIVGIFHQGMAFIPQFFLIKRGGQQGIRFDLKWQNIKACLGDATATTGFDRHYVFHVSWAARVLSRTKPKSHVDISSSLYFASCVSAFLPIHFLDYRPAKLNLSGLDEQSGDICHLPFAGNSLNSLSCMHVVEHIGLGRYGDPLDYDGDISACNELRRVLAPGGQLLFVVPVGAKPVIMYNAHRIYTYSQVIKMFDELEIEEFCLIPDDPADGGLVTNPSNSLLNRQIYGCGCFLFKKPA